MAAETCWVLSDNRPGNENPCLGLAEAVGLETVVKRFNPRPPWSRLPPRLWFAPFRAPAPGSDPLEPPWPDLLIACGRQTVALSIAIKARSGGRTFTVQLLDPRVAPGRFDLVAAPEHDRLNGSNVISTVGALNRVTTARLAAAAETFGAAVAHLPAPRVAVLIGGPSKHHRMTGAVAAGIGDRLAALARDTGAGLMVTASQRTGRDNAEALRRRLDGVAAVMWDGKGRNPYFGYLALASAIVVTNDSVAMVSEACTTGKPVHVIELPGGSAKLDRFHESLRRAGCARPFTGRLEHWRYPPLRETERVGEEVRRRIGLG
ncbi:MAG: mitochondrial fission ELM1 family protein [Proteobacteria bacterium]|nr:mitochondrial fission ELM1 family protein [Pseudomonadota bacterium]